MAYCIQDAGLTEQNRASALPNSVSYGLVKLFNTLKIPDVFIYQEVFYLKKILFFKQKQYFFIYF